MGVSDRFKQTRTRARARQRKKDFDVWGAARLAAHEYYNSIGEQTTKEMPRSERVTETHACENDGEPGEQSPCHEAGDGRGNPESNVTTGGCTLDARQRTCPRARPCPTEDGREPAQKRQKGRRKKGGAPRRTTRGIGDAANLGSHRPRVPSPRWKRAGVGDRGEVSRCGPRAPTQRRKKDSEISSAKRHPWKDFSDNRHLIDRRQDPRRQRICGIYIYMCIRDDATYCANDPSVAE